MGISIKIVILTLVMQAILTAKIQGSKHDLSVTNPRGTLGGTSVEICVFCHTPHNADSSIGALWNRKITDRSVFTMYGGGSGVPNNPSLACLSCHDGVSARGYRNTTSSISAVAADDMHWNLNNTQGSGSDPEALNSNPNCYACHTDLIRMPSKAWQVGPDLTNDHPVSVSYGAARAKSPYGFRVSPINGLKLVDGNVECVSCHDPHIQTNSNGDEVMFLRTSNKNSALCKSCHTK